MAEFNGYIFNGNKLIIEKRAKINNIQTYSMSHTYEKLNKNLEIVNCGNWYASIMILTNYMKNDRSLNILNTIVYSFSSHSKIFLR